MTPADVRKRLVEALEADLVGPFTAEHLPGGGQEVLPLPPSRWYLTGFLAPQFDRAPDADDTDAVGELAAGSESQAEDAGSDEPEAKRPHRFPASMGLSVFLPAAAPGSEVDHIEVEIAYAEYIKEELAEDNEKKTKAGWRRVPHGPYPVQVPLDPRALGGRDGICWPEAAALRLRGELRTTDIDGLPPGARVLSLFLVNERPPLDRDRDLNFIFQVRLVLRYPRGFLARPNHRGEDANDDDQRVLALTFRDRFEWAVGHNTSVEMPRPDADGKVRELRTTQLPRYEVRSVRHETAKDKIGLEITEMRQLAALDGPGLVGALSPLVDAYGAWIERQRGKPIRGKLEDTRTELVDEAEQARTRIRAGIDLLGRNPEVREAFKLANLAMHAQALQADRWREDRRYKGDAQPRWRPFQLAFVLMALASITDPTHDDRKIADLIYFPTGGGKTEAYLGLIAITLILRRLRGKNRADEGRGVAVVLRYTLRLLTLDQLGRAATLMCALEEMRRRDPKRLGNARFAVGLWVGQSATANRLKDVHAALHDFTPGRTDSPFPLTTCPWCGEDIKIHNIKLVDDDGKPSKTRFTRAVVYCEGRDCLYTESKRPGQGLPVLFVDEQIYKELPDFLVATVDKFAMMPWRGEAGMLFGRATHLDDLRAYGVMHDPPKGARPLPQGLHPPELIVQDELHLISGPLGTMVGLYETAIDYLSARNVDGVLRAPKIVCSTATARRAREQIQALFDRDMAIFPPRGIDDGDNFFATVDQDSPGRLYVGVAAPGRALRAVIIRTYATVLAAAQLHFDPKGPLDQPADPYMTLVGYFNALRELGGMRRLVEDEVKTRVKSFAEGKKPHHHVGPHPWAASRNLGLPAELTSREPTERVKETKRRLATRRAAADTDKSAEPLDVVLASNMISVGLDVDRLGLMVVAGQPKTTSEYIQATSRVGRSYPGLVLTCLNASRPRDRSHYERFVAYHESFYREVEATSVTPFSLQTIDRGIVGTLISMIRHGLLDMEPPRGFMRLHHNRALAEDVLEVLVTRARRHREWHDETAERRIQDELRARGRSFLDAWERVISRAARLDADGGAAQRIYSDLDRAKHEGKPVMYFATDDPPHDHDERRFVAPTSMRDVEPSTHIWLRFAHLDERR
ncbi:DISARM system helicase DrmA [Nannocystis pusilla]|uniref:DISARM system helicase DrmA n=1 Tax=Nannocystis pusilla TaxID=889268 RepID=A0ABS7TME3_9BACT|nr:DISARM system helicase DrmA [Nannocystis pusilla]